MTSPAAHRWIEAKTVDDPEAADLAQVAALEEYMGELEALHERALKIELLASKEVGALVDAVPSRIMRYFDDIAGGDRLCAKKIDATVADVETSFEELKRLVRADLGVDAIK